MWCHLTFRCQSNWLTGKKINSKRPVPAKASGEVASGVGKSRIGALADQRDEAEHKWAGKPCAWVSWPWERQEEEISHLLEHPSPSLPSSTGVWDPLEEQTLTPSQGGDSGHSQGSWGSTTLSEVLTSQWFFFCPCSEWRKKRLLKKKLFHWEKKSRVKQITNFGHFEKSSSFLLTLNIFTGFNPKKKVKTISKQNEKFTSQNMDRFHIFKKLFLPQTFSSWRKSSK